MAQPVQRHGRWLWVLSIVSALALQQGCGDDDRDTPIDAGWLSYFRLTQGTDTQLYVEDDWDYYLVQTPTVRKKHGVLTAAQRRMLAEVFSDGLETYASDSMSSSGTDMGECDPTAARPIVHSIVIEADPPIGESGFGCWSSREGISDATHDMIERMEELLESLESSSDM